ncbi:two-component system, OmpR family, sensor histidine kinase VicK [Planifilum fulgidum]|uniref:histidine kinase n=1 Tax=Planifilum fulgidum TaxID=201973 RepID=A0A1I2LNA0_9BACL|nr:ATP-binding protein [Planifilum fulgidum]MBO2496391.1 cell wall metabolism sensor histidine kinase WalK [Bacillota bacterium]MBO2531319.1 cell wall metabolism sensor histidine kinase WalK [Thermoactinomycetaceae bacterium]SFF78496.1 two-component system, OmpR family, sensor histidine kinase VicK [Planifilum fulgidum]
MFVSKLRELLNSIQWKLMVIYFSLILIAIQLIGVYFFDWLGDYYEQDFDEKLEKQAALLASSSLAEILDQKTAERSDRTKEIENLVQQLFILDKGTDTVQVVDSDGIVLSTSSTKNRNVIGQKNVRVTQALQSFTTDKQFRVDPATGYRMKLLIRPIKNSDGQAVGAVYIEASMEEMYATIRRISKNLIRITLLALGLTALLGVILARTIANPVKEITRQATAMAEGDFDRQVDVKSGDEIGRLAAAFNHLAERLREALSQNEEEKEKLESVLANMSDGVLATDGKGRVIVRNRRAEEILDREIALGEPLEEVLPLSEPLPLPLAEETQIHLEQNAEDKEEHSVIKITFTPIKRHGQEMVGLIAVLKDVTEEAKLDRQRKEFVANVSHELRTPLTTIKSYLESLEDGAIGDPELASRFLRVTLQEAERMNRLINDLLLLSRLDAKETRFHKQAVDLREMLEEVADRFSIPCEKKGIRLALQVSGPLPRVYVDRDQIDQVLDNLLSNAVKFTPEGGAITIRARRQKDGMAEVSVSDTGIGIPKKDLGRIFERFYRVDKARSRQMGGTGLGLSIAREIVLAHGGDIGIDSVYRRGTTVTFTLPPWEPEVIR